MTGVLALVVALLVAAGLGVVWKVREGRFAATRARRDGVRSTTEDARLVLGPVDLGADLGADATLVQLSTAFCAPCRATRTVLSAVADARPGVRWVELDAEAHLDLVRRLDVRRTPTVLLLDRRGRVVTRASGLPQRSDVERLVDAVVAAD